MMNEQEMFLRKKIEDREKKDIIIAYVLIVVLVAIIGIILYLKFVRKEDDVLQEEYTANYISLNDISNSLNNSLLANRYINDDASFNAAVSGNSLVVTYSKEDNVVNLNIPVVGNELVVTMPEDNNDVVEDIYKEITNVVCIYYGNTENDCRNTINNISSDSSVLGIRYVNDNVYIDMTRSIDIVSMNNNVVKNNINNKEYSLDSLDVAINTLDIIIDDNKITFSGNLNKLSDDNVTMLFKIYDVNGSVLDDISIEYTDDFSVEFIYNTYNINDITDYSIEIIK